MSSSSLQDYVELLMQMQKNPAHQQQHIIYYRLFKKKEKLLQLLLRVSKNPFSEKFPK